MTWRKTPDYGSILLTRWEAVTYLGDASDDGLSHDDRDYGAIPDAFDRTESYATGRGWSERYVQNHRTTVLRAAELQHRQALTALASSGPTTWRKHRA